MPTCYKGVYELLMDMNPMHIDTSASLLEVISDLPFADKINTESIFTQFKSLQCYAMDCLVKTGGVNLPSTASILKKIVNDDKTNNNQCAELVKLLSFLCMFPSI